MAADELRLLHRFIRAELTFDELRVELIKAVIKNGSNSREANARVDELT